MVAGNDEQHGAAPRGFEQRSMDAAVIALPLLELFDAEPTHPQPVIIDLNLAHPHGLDGARQRLHELLGEVTGREVSQLDGSVIDRLKGQYTQQYAYATLTPEQTRALIAADLRDDGEPRAVWRIWPDFEVEALLTRSVATIKGDAAHIAFNARGQGIVWAVLDTGIDASHPHFTRHRNLAVEAPIEHMDFSGAAAKPVEEPEDANGHGTHVAGIIAGEYDPAAAAAEARRRTEEAARLAGDSDVDQEQLDAAQQAADLAAAYAQPRYTAIAQRTPDNETRHEPRELTERITGVAPMARLVSLKVLSDGGGGRVSNLMAALGYVAQVNNYGRKIRIHGINMSVGYGFDPEWFACGQSPLCVEVDRLVRSGVMVVVAAGNTGYLQRGSKESHLNAGLGLTINDPGNAEHAITVGSTHRAEPHTYGVSYFSSKGPTGDGRRKPDLVAPGEKVVSCATGTGAAEVTDEAEIHYREMSGTSMAAPHVSGAIAALLSIRGEFVGQPERIKQVLLDSATDLGREHYFQGAGLVDLMRAIQAL